MHNTLFDQWCCRYGIPERFHSDGANNVHGYVVKELCKILGADKSKSSRLHPQGDGLSEAFVKVLKSCLQKQVETHGTDWDLYLHSTAFAIRSNMSLHTKVSPAKIILGAELRQPVQQLLPPKQYVQMPFNQKQACSVRPIIVRRIKNNHTTCTNHITTFQDQDERAIR